MTGIARPLSLFGDLRYICRILISLDESLENDSSSMVGYSFVYSILKDIFFDLLELSMVARFEL